MVAEQQAQPKRRRAARVAGWALAGSTMALSGGVWLERRAIVEHFVDQRLAAARVPARYRIVALGPLEQRLAGVRLGDPSNPDLVAREVRLTLRYGLTGPYLAGVEADGVRLSAAIADGRLSLGAVDRLLPRAAPGAPFALPDLDVTLRDMLVALSTPAGKVDVSIAGAGNLARSFRGTVMADAPALAVGGCSVKRLHGDMAVEVADRRPRLRGPLSAAQADCLASGLRLGTGGATIDVAFAPTLDRWQGATSVAGFAGRVRGVTFGPTAGTATMAGDARSIAGAVDLSLARPRMAMVAAQALGLVGTYRAAPGTGTGAYEGELRMRRAALARDARRSIPRVAATLAGSPVGPVAQRVASELDRLLSGADANAALSLSIGRGGAADVRLHGASITGGDGAFVRIEERGGIGWRDGRWRLDGTLASGGGALPVTSVAIRRMPDGGLAGIAQMAPYATADARLALEPVRFVARGGITQFATVARVSGPLAGGRVDGLVVPLVGRVARSGALRLDEGCRTAGFDALRIAGMRLDPARFRVCGAPLLTRTADGRVALDARVDGVALTGRSGSAPLSIRSGPIAVSTAGVRLAALAVRLGEVTRQTRLDVGSIAGRFATGGAAGTFAAAGGQIGNVPLLLSGADGTWRLAGGALTLDGALGVADAQVASPRFNPLAARDVTLRLVDGRIAAAGALADPKSGARIAQVRLRHDLASGAGDAVLDVPRLRFDRKALQPEALTPLTLGVVANLVGTVTGQGRIAWNAAGVTSSGDFASDRLDFAAAFGPVVGVAGRIHFSDLLGLVTPPRQEVVIAGVNPGVLVADGVAHYQLVGNNRVQVEDARWPFAGGTLTLEPSLLDFSRASERHLTFRIAGLDAAKFIQQLEFPNISATGTFDGVLPMVFDDAGGRIERGSLAARAPGTLAYVGELSNAQLGTMGKLAFDALKAIRYSALDVSLDGRLDGEIVSRVRFEGVRQATGDKGLVARMIRNLPFRFNIAIRAPFRGLIGSARSFADPGLLLDRAHLAPDPPPVQPPASAPVR